MKTLDMYIYIFFILKSENLKAFTIYRVLAVYYTVHTENDETPAQTGSSYRRSVRLYRDSTEFFGTFR